MKFIRIIVGLAITAGTLFYIFRNYQLKDIYNVLKNVSLSWIISGFALYIASYLLLALRWKILIHSKPIKFHQIFSITCIHNCLNNVLPARIGEASYLYLLKKKQNVPLTEGFSTLIAARILDLMSMILILLVSAILSREARSGIFIIYILSIFIVAIILIFSFFKFSLFEKLLSLFRFIFQKAGLGKNRKIELLIKKALELASGLKKIYHNPAIRRIFLISILIFLSRYILIYTFLAALKIPMAFWKVAFGFSISALAYLLPVQGLFGLGNFEGGWTLGFMVVGLNKDTALLSGFSFHIILFLYFILLGTYGLVSVRDDR